MQTIPKMVFQSMTLTRDLWLVSSDSEIVIIPRSTLTGAVVPDR